MPNTTHLLRPTTRNPFAVLLALLLGLVLTFGAAVPAHAADTVTMPKVVGKSADKAKKLLKREGLSVKLKAAADGPVFISSHWKVTKQSVKAGKDVAEGKKITLTVKLKKKYAPTPAPTPTEAAEPTPTADPNVTSAGLDGGHAGTACDRYGEAQFPYGWKAHLILGVIAAENQGDHYFYKFEADVTNMYNAEASATVECVVGGSNDAPVVTEFNVY